MRVDDTKIMIVLHKYTTIRRKKNVIFKVTIGLSSVVKLSV